MISDNVFNTNIDYYKVFYYAVKFKNITLAANRLSLTQPNVTKTIKRLEEDLKCKLFFRTNRGIALTAEGEMLWARVEPACELIIAAERELEENKKLSTGTMDIASMEFGFSAYILPALRLFLKVYPKVKVRIRAQMPNQILSMLKSGLIDLAVLSHSDELDMAAFDCRTIDVYQQALIVGLRYSFLTEREYTLDELTKYPFISMPEGFPGKMNMNEYFQKYGLIFEPDIEVHSMDLMIQAVSADLGIGTVPLQAVKNRIENGTLFPLRLRDKLPERRALAITNRSIQVSRATQVFINEFLLKPSSTDES